MANTARISGFEIVARALAEAGHPEIAERKRLRRATPDVARVTGRFRLSREALSDFVVEHAQAHGLMRDGLLNVDEKLQPLFVCSLVPLDALGFLLDALLE